MSRFSWIDPRNWFKKKHDPLQDALDFIQRYDVHVIRHVIERDLEGNTNTHILLELRIPHNKEENQE